MKHNQPKTCLAVYRHDTTSTRPRCQAEEPVLYVVGAVGAHDVSLDEAHFGEAACHCHDRLAHFPERLHATVGHVLDPDPVARLVVYLLQQEFVERYPACGTQSLKARKKIPRFMAKPTWVFRIPVSRRRTL